MKLMNNNRGLCYLLPLKYNISLYICSNTAVIVGKRLNKRDCIIIKGNILLLIAQVYFSETSLDVA